jgi:predicted  nucleic acid-binding Zn-ribbon protein
MLTPLLEKLLILQDRDTRRLGLEAQLKAAPREIAAVEQKIAAEKAAEDKLAKYKNQQMQVRKNDEFQALGHEITTTQAAIDTLEEQELQVMYAIDEARKKFVAAEALLKQNITGHEARIRMLRERETNLAAELTGAQAGVATARSPLDEPTLRIYDRIALQKQPVCVPLQGGKCGGCHLKVSSEAESASRGKNPDIKIPVCDQCGRILYWES